MSKGRTTAQIEPFAHPEHPEEALVETGNNPPLAVLQQQAAQLSLRVTQLAERLERLNLEKELAEIRLLLSTGIHPRKDIFQELKRQQQKIEDLERWIAEFSILGRFTSKLRRIVKRLRP